MKTKAVRLYGEKDMRLEEFTLPEMKENEIMAEVITDSLCMSTYKAATQGMNHKKVPNDIAEHPIIVGHEFCCKLIGVGEKWKHEFKVGQKCCLQPNIGIDSKKAPGYSYRFIGGDATKIIFFNEIMENNCLLPFHGDTYFEGSLVEPLSCVIGAFHANYHLKKVFSYEHVMGIKEGGNVAILGATGPMGFLAIDYALHGPIKPKLVVVTGRTQHKLDLAERLYTKKEAEKEGIQLIYVNTKDLEDVSQYMKAITDEKKGFDDVFIFAPSQQLIKEGAEMLAYDGCLNFFSGPSDTEFTAEMNFYDVHYNATHVVGTSGGNTEDMKEALQLIESKKVNVAKIATHILGLDAVAETTLKLPKLAGGKKIVYTHKSFPLTEVAHMEDLGHNNFVKQLIEIVEQHDGLWSGEAETYFMEYAKEI